MINEMKEWTNLFLTALGSGGIVYLVTYFIGGKKDRAEEQKTVIGYLKARLTKLEKRDKETKKRLEALEKKYLDLEIKFELTDFEKKLAFKWIAEQPNGSDFLDSVKKEVKSKEEFLNRVKMLKKPQIDKNITNTILIIFFVSLFLVLFYFAYTYTIDKLAETANLEIQMELEKLKNNYENTN